MSDDFKEAFDSFFHDAGFKFLRLLMQMKKALLKSGNPLNILSDSETNFKLRFKRVDNQRSFNEHE